MDSATTNAETNQYVHPPKVLIKNSPISMDHPLRTQLGIYSPIEKITDGIISLKTVFCMYFFPSVDKNIVVAFSIIVVDNYFLNSRYPEIKKKALT